MTSTSTPCHDTLERIFAYRLFDLRDRFPQTLETFCQALGCLQSHNAYLTDISGKIVVYLQGGRALSTLKHSFIRHAGNSLTVIPSSDNNQAFEAVEVWLTDVLLREADDSVDALRLRPSRLNILLDQCDPNAPDPDDIPT